MYGNLGDRDACTSWAVVSIGVPAGLSDCSAPGDSWVLATHPFSSYPQGDSCDSGTKSDFHALPFVLICWRGVSARWSSTRGLVSLLLSRTVNEVTAPPGWGDFKCSILHVFGLCAFLSVTVLRVQSYLGYENNGLGDQHQGQILTAWAIWANLYTFVNRWSSLPPLLVAALWCSNPCANTGAIFREEGSSDVPNHLSLGTCTCLCH